MYKVLKNCFSNEVYFKCQSEIVERSESKEILEKIYNNDKFFIKKLPHNDIIYLDSVNKLIFSPELIKQIKKLIGNFYFINNIQATVNGFTSATHRDSQSLGFTEDGIKNGSKIFKILVYFNRGKTINKGLDINILDFNLKNIFFNKKIYNKLNFYYNFYLRSKLMKTISLNVGDVIIMDGNAWHRATPQKNLNRDISKFSWEKILLDYEVVTDKKLAIDYAKHVKKHFVLDKSQENLNISGKFKEILFQNNIQILNL